jgi:hypothetical protein
MLTRLLLLPVLGLLAATASAQYRWETIDKLKIAFLVHDKLQAVPEPYKDEDPHQVARYRPKDESDYLHGKLGSYHWDLFVYQFDKNRSKEAPTTGDGDLPTRVQEKLEELRSEHVAKDFEDFVRGKDPRHTDTRRFLEEAKEVKGSSKRPPHSWWEYSDTQKAGGWAGEDAYIIWYKYAAVYEVGETQIALVCGLPVMRGKSPDRKYEKIAKQMVTSLVINEDAEGTEGSEVRDKYADTPERQAELDLLKENISDFENWDYFTTPNYMIAFSWDRKDHRDRTPAYKFAIDMGERIEEIRELFAEHYPPHKGMKVNYSVIRVCSDYDEFLKYGEIPPGVVGWFSPATKELCVFRDVDHIFDFDDDGTLAVVYHEAWHQYADQYWPDVELHRWFDEGLAEYFGTWRRRGRSWRYVYHEGRYDSVRAQMKTGALIRSDAIIGWERAKFYGARAPDHYAQAWVMVDFLKRGEEKLRSRWDPSWSKILPNYAKACLEEKDPEKAVEKALEGIDVDAFEEAWKEWFERGYIKRS